MRSRGSLLLFLSLFFSMSAATAFGWGKEGHQIVAAIAQRAISPTTAAQVTALLDGKSLVDVAPVPDEWRKTQPETAGWHFVNIPVSATGYDETRDCPPQTSEVGRNCAVAAITHFISVLEDTSQTKDARARALTFLVHFLGDIHQPLHSANNDDAGGNKVAVTWLGQATDSFGGKEYPWNLHAVWDAAILSKANPVVDTYAAQLLSTDPPADAGSGSVVDWVNGAFGLAKSNSYVIPAGTPSPLDETYYTTNLPVVNAQIYRGGLRLAGVLEAALGATAQATQAATATTAPTTAAPTSGKRRGPDNIYPIASENPGATNPDITPDNMQQTICNPKWSTKSIRPPSNYTTELKKKQMDGVYNYKVPQSNDQLKDANGKLDTTRCIAGSANTECYEEDHLISLELGGNPTDPKNLWPQPYAPTPGARQKDLVENHLHTMVCTGAMSLRDAQTAISTDWYAVYLTMTPAHKQAANQGRRISVDPPKQ